MLEYWTDLRDCLRADEAVMIAWVEAASSHSPGTAGARWLRSTSGRQAGTIGGGVMELAVARRAQRLLDSPQPFFERVTLHHDPKAEGAKSGMMCAGWQRNVYAMLLPERDLDAVEQLVAALSVSLDRRFFLGPEGLARAEDASLQGESLELRTLNARRVAVIGAGHCGAATARAMVRLGYAVSVWDTRPEILAGLNAMNAQAHEVDDFADAGPGIDHPSSTAVVVMTPDVGGDVRASVGVLRGGFPFIGWMGSAAKLVEIRCRLENEGFTRSELDRVTAPVGLAIGSRTPEEIAISVAAQVIAERDQWSRA